MTRYTLWSSHSDNNKYPKYVHFSEFFQFFLVTLQEKKIKKKKIIFLKYNLNSILYKNPLLISKIQTHCLPKIVYTYTKIAYTIVKHMSFNQNLYVII